MNPSETAAAAIPSLPAARAAGIAIAAATVLSIIFVALDGPASGSTPLDILQSMAGMRGTKEMVHSVAIASVLAYAFAYSVFAWRMDLRRPLVLAGLTTYLTGCVAMIGATILDGFISGDVASQFAAASPDSVKQGYNLVVFIGIALTDLAKLGWVLQAVASLAWSIILLQGRGLNPAFNRPVGLVGLVSSGLVLAAVFSSDVNMSMTVLLGILFAQAIWNLAAAALLIRSKATAGSIGFGATQAA